MNLEEEHDRFGHAELLAALFCDDGISRENLFKRLGLRLCPRCGKATNMQIHYPGCREEHSRPYPKPPGQEHIKLVCQTCTEPFLRSVTQFNNTSKRGQDLIFCTRHCHGQWLAYMHGFGVIGTKHKRPWSRPDMPNYKKPGEYRCTKGHSLELGDPNTYVWKGHRQCRTCGREYARNRYVREREALTYCKNGHPVTKISTYTHSDGRQTCRRCTGQKQPTNPREQSYSWYEILEWYRGGQSIEELAAATGATTDHIKTILRFYNKEVSDGD